MKLKLLVTLLFAVLMASACGSNDDGRGNGIEECGTEGTDIVANFEDPEGMENPAYLAEFNSSQPANAAVYGADNSFTRSGDLADQVGEIACLSEDGTIVLTGVGNQIRSNVAENRSSG